MLVLARSTYKLASVPSALIHYTAEHKEYPQYRAQIPINPVHESRLFIRAIVVSVDLFLRVMEKMQRLVKTVMTFF